MLSKFNIKVVIVVIFLLLKLEIFSQIINTVAGDSLTGYYGDNVLATSTSLNFPYGVAIDAGKNLFIADTKNNRIRRVSPSGIITTIAGNDTAGFSGDGGLAMNAKLNYPTTLKFDKNGNLFFSDVLNYRIRKIDTNGIITTIVGNGSNGYSGDGGPALSAEIDQVLGIAFDKNNTLYFSQQNNAVVRKVDQFGFIYTVAGIGTPGYSGDAGQAIYAKLNNPNAIEFDAKNNLIVVDGLNHRIRMVDLSGIISTVIGNGNQGYSGDGGEATSANLAGPFGLTIDSIGNIYFGDAWNKVIRRVDTSGIISTIAGNGFDAGPSCSTLPGSFSGDGGPAINASLNGPGGLSFDSNGNLYLADVCNNRIRKVDNLVNSFSTIPSLIPKIEVFPNPTANGEITLNINTNQEPSSYKCTIYNNLGQEVKSMDEIKSSNTINTFKIDLSGCPGGIYFIKLSSTEVSIIQKVILLY